MDIPHKGSLITPENLLAFNFLANFQCSVCTEVVQKLVRDINDSFPPVDDNKLKLLCTIVVAEELPIDISCGDIRLCPNCDSKMERLAAMEDELENLWNYLQSKLRLRCEKAGLKSVPATSPSVIAKNNLYEFSSHLYYSKCPAEYDRKALGADAKDIFTTISKDSKESQDKCSKEEVVGEDDDANNNKSASPLQCQNSNSPIDLSFRNTGDKVDVGDADDDEGTTIKDRLIATVKIKLEDNEEMEDTGGTEIKVEMDEGDELENDVDEKESTEKENYANASGGDEIDNANIKTEETTETETVDSVETDQELKSETLTLTETYEVVEDANEENDNEGGDNLNLLANVGGVTVEEDTNDTEALSVVEGTTIDPETTYVIVQNPGQSGVSLIPYNDFYSISSAEQDQVNNDDSYVNVEAPTVITFSPSDDFLSAPIDFSNVAYNTLSIEDDFSMSLNMENCSNLSADSFDPNEMPSITDLESVGGEETSTLTFHSPLGAIHQMSTTAEMLSLSRTREENYSLVDPKLVFASDDNVAYFSSPSVPYESGRWRTINPITKKDENLFSSRCKSKRKLTTVKPRRESDDTFKFPAEKKQQCLSCDKTFSNLWHLQRHVKIHDKVKRPKFDDVTPAAEEPPKILNAVSTTSSELLSVDKIEDDIYSCCGTSFPNKVELVNHLKSHIEITPTV